MKDWCDINKLSINLSKTIYMIVKSSRKRNHEFIINIQSANGTNHTLERTDSIKYLGVMLPVSFKYHIAYVCSRMSRNLGIISKLRYYLTLSQLKQIYYTLIYPYISYAILAWGSTYKTYIQKVQTKQNHAIRLIFQVLLELSVNKPIVLSL